MDEPERGGEPGERACMRGRSAREQISHDREQQPPVGKMDEQVDEVKRQRVERIALKVCGDEDAAEGVVHREREVGNGPVRQFTAREHWPPWGENRADRRVFGDLGEVVPDERAADARCVGSGRDDDGKHRQGQTCHTAAHTRGHGSPAFSRASSSRSASRRARAASAGSPRASLVIASPVQARGCVG